MKTILVLGLILAAVALACKSQTRPKSVEVVTPQKAEQLLSSKQIQLVDVRTLEEYDEGHIPHAKNIDIYNTNFKTTIAQLDKNKPIMVYCRSGMRSASATKILDSLGFTKIYDIKGGFNKWKNQSSVTE